MLLNFFDNHAGSVIETGTRDHVIDRIKGLKHTKLRPIFSDGLIDFHIFVTLHFNRGDIELNFGTQHY